MTGGELVIAVVHEAVAKFGPITSENSKEISTWVQQRVEAIRREQGLSVPFVPRDVRAAAAGEDR